MNLHAAIPVLTVMNFHHGLLEVLVVFSPAEGARNKRAAG